MATTQIADIVVPQVFTNYVLERSVVSTALYQSGVLAPNAEIASQLQAGSESFFVPFWKDLSDTEANISTDNPADLAAPLKITAGRQTVRKSFLNQSWSTADLAAELSGDDPLGKLQTRVVNYWDRQYEKRLIATLLGVLASNVASNADMIVDISGLAGAASAFNGLSVIDTALTLGDRLSDVKMIAMHSHIYGQALKNDEITFFKPSANSVEVATYKGMGVIVDDNLTPANGVYTTILMGSGAVGFGSSEPRVGLGTEIYRAPAQGNGAGVTTLFSRLNSALHPLGFTFTGASLASESPSIAELALAANWSRVATSRKSIPLAFLISK